MFCTAAALKYSICYLSTQPIWTKCICEIWGSHSIVYEDSSLQGCYMVVQTVTNIFEEHGASIFWVLQSKESGLLHLGCQSPKMEEKYSSKTPVTIYQSTQHNISEDLNLHIVSIYSCVCAYFPSWNKQHSLLMETFLLTGGAQLLHKTRTSEWYCSYLHENW